MSKSNKTKAAKTSPVSKLDSVRASVAPVASNGGMVAASLAVVARLSIDERKLRVESNASKSASSDYENGKIVFVTASERDGGTAQAYLRKLGFGTISPAAYKVANALDMIGEGPAFCAESDADACPLRWHLVTSAILNLLAKANDDELTAGVREEIAKVYRSRPADGGKLLAAIKKSLQPKSDKGDGDDEETGAETENDNDWRALVKSLAAVISETGDVSTLAEMQKAIGALAAIASDKLQHASKPVEAIAA